jgi:hypothetical protein
MRHIRQLLPQNFPAVIFNRRNFRFHLFVANFDAAMRLQVFAVTTATRNHRAVNH